MNKLVFLLLAVFCFKAYSINKTIYGKDDRLDFYELQDTKIKALSSSVAAMIDKDALIKKDGFYKLIATNLQNESNCSNIRFKEQISIAKCSGFLIDNDLLVTTSNCVKTQKDCDQFIWAFDFKRNFKQHRVSTLNSKQVYTCSEIVNREHSPGASLSYTVIRLSKKNNTATPLILNTQDNITTKQGVLMLGHPQGLPLKASLNSTTSKIYRHSFRANLDSAQSSAGSPVFDTKTLTVQGMYIRGPRAQRSRNGCNRPLSQSDRKSLEVIMHAKHIVK